MWYLSIILIAVIGLLFTPKLMAQSNKGTESKRTVSSKETIEIQSDTLQPLFSKSQIEEKLKHLATTPPPEKMNFGAMCYSTSMAIGTISYICPVCGEKTLYKYIGENEWVTSNGEELSDLELTHRKRRYEAFEMVLREINACRREVQKVKGINISLDESGFCDHCCPYITYPILYLLINIGGESDTVKTPNIDYMDIRLIHEFLSGSLVHKGYADEETPLVDYMGRIKELLGVKE